MRSSILAAVLLLVPLAGVSQQAAQAPLRLYVLDGGTITNPDPSWAGVTVEDVKGFTSMPDPAYLVVHPSGTLLWDTGLGDHLLGLPAEETRRRGQGTQVWGQVVTSALRSQLSEIGYTPEDITYVAMSHSHFDHTGNANDFAQSVWLVQRAELDSPDFASSDRRGSFDELKNGEMVTLDGDHDVFGDGTVIIKSTPGHTPGHQSLSVDLAATGPVVLSGDLYHYEAERLLNKMPEDEVGPGVNAASRTSLEAFIRETGATLWIQHEVMHWARIDKSPAYYD